MLVTVKVRALFISVLISTIETRISVLKINCVITLISRNRTSSVSLLNYFAFIFANLWIYVVYTTKKNFYNDHQNKLQTKWIRNFLFICVERAFYFYILSCCLYSNGIIQIFEWIESYCLVVLNSMKKPWTKIALCRNSWY